MRCGSQITCWVGFTLFDTGAGGMTKLPVGLVLPYLTWVGGHDGLKLHVGLVLPYLTWVGGGMMASNYMLGWFNPI